MPHHHRGAHAAPSYDGPTAAMERAWAGALTLIILVMLLNLAARLISKYFSPKGGRR